MTLADWLEDRFHSYDLIYLDPLILKLKEPNILKRYALWSELDECCAKVVRAIRLPIHIGTRATFFSSDGHLETILHNADVYRKVVETLESPALHNSLHPRSFQNVTAICEDGAERWLNQHVANRKGAKSLVLIREAVLNKVSYVPPERNRPRFAVQESGERTLAYVLSDSPYPLMSLDRPRVRATVDSRAAATWSDQWGTIAAASWYPQTRILGLYRTQSGQPYIDIVAILAKKYPRLHTILVQRPTAPARESLLELLQEMTTLLEKEVRRLRSRRTPPRFNPAELLTYGRQYVYPLLLITLCCELNGAGQLLLEQTAKPIHAALHNYGAIVRELKEIVDKGQDGLVVDFPWYEPGNSLSWLLPPNP